MAPLVVYESGTGTHIVEPNEHQVTNLTRGLKPNRGEVIKAAARTLVLSFTLLAIGLLLLVVLTQWLPKEGGLLLLLIYFVFGAWVLGSAWAFLGGLVVAAKHVAYGMRSPKKSAPEAAVKTFLTSIHNEVWTRAWNCLTDRAQNAGQLTFPSETDLQRMMPSCSIDSLDSFRRFWSGIRFAWVPRWRRMRIDAVEPATVKIIVPLRVTWKANRREQQREIECVFIAVNRGGHWFLCNGFFWPDLKRLNG